MNASRIYLFLIMSLALLLSSSRQVAAQASANTPTVTAETPSDPANPKKLGDPRKPIIRWSGFKGNGPFVIEIKNGDGKTLFFGGDANAKDHYQYSGNLLAIDAKYTIRVVDVGTREKEGNQEKQEATYI